MFYSPRNLEDLQSALEKKNENTYFIAGGTDLIIQLKAKGIVEYDIIDITKLKEFRYIKEDENHIYIGALATMTDICKNEIIKNDLPAIYRAAYELGSELIRNRATIGGNIGNASQSADVVLSIFAYEGKIKTLNSKLEEKIRPIDEIVISRNKTSLEEDEIITEIIIEKKDRISGFRKVGSRRAVTISKISCAINLLMKDEKVSKPKIFLGAVGLTPVEAKLLEKEFLNKKLEDIDVERLKEAAFEEIELAIPTRSSKYYKRIAIEGLIEDLYWDLINYEEI